MFRIIWYRMVFFFAIIFAINPAIAKGEELELPFFKELWSGSAFDSLPEGMIDPHDLKEVFEAEPRSVDWAVRAEAEITRAIARIEAGEVQAQRVRCHQATCEAIFTMSSQSIENRSMLNDELDRYIGAAAVALDKEITMAVGGGRADVTGILVYFHDKDLKA